jgi:phage terminase large subunit
LVIKLTPKQKQLMEVIKTHRNTLAVGGSRSGKTFGILYFCITMGLLFPNVKMLVSRRIAQDARNSLWKETIPLVLEGYELRMGKDYEVNEKDMDLKLPQGSLLRVAGLNDKERVDAILGTQYAIIYCNESTDIPYGTVQKLQTRLSQQVPFGNKFIADLNPGSQAHWSYRLWYEGVMPHTLTPLPADLAPTYGRILMNPQDNIENLPSDYIPMALETLEGEYRKRFLLGEYSQTSELQVFMPENYFDDSDFFLWCRGREYKVRYVAGLDIGYEDADALAVIAYIEDDPQTWLVYEYKGRRNTITELEKAMQDAEKWLRAWFPQPSFYLEVYGDTGGGGKKVVKELNTVLSFPIVPAYKMGKYATGGNFGAIDLLQEEVNRPDRFHIRRGGPFDKEAEQTVWTRNDLGTIERILDEEAFHPDEMYAILYAFRYLWSYGNSALKHVVPVRDEEPDGRVEKTFVQREIEGWLDDAGNDGGTW